jgi:hypothetical protein
VVEAKAPVRHAAVRHRRVRRLALVDRRQAPAKQHLAAQVQLLWRLVAGIDPARRLKPLELAFVEVEALRLAHDRVGVKAEPIEIIADRLVELRRRALAVGIVDAQQEPPAVLPGEQEIVKRGADVADVQPPGRRRREAGRNRHSAAFAPVWKKLLIG